MHILALWLAGVSLATPLPGESQSLLQYAALEEHLKLVPQGTRPSGCNRTSYSDVSDELQASLLILMRRDLFNLTPMQSQSGLPSAKRSNTALSLSINFKIVSIQIIAKANSIRFFDV
jgi:hypothetical protein